MPQFTFSWEEGSSCQICGRPLRLLRTESRRVISISYGTFSAVERQGYCPRHPRLATVRSGQLRRIVAPGSEYAYDVLARVGVARFLECRQTAEIQDELSRLYGLVIPPSTIRYLARKFVAYFEIVHRQSISLLRAHMKTRGGYILHVDGTCEEGSGVLLVCIDSLSGQILQSRKIASENAEEIKAVLKEVRRDWGRPLAVVHDLGKAIVPAVGEVFKGTPQFVCHYHLAADVGGDILLPHVDRLRRLFRDAKVRPRLRHLIRSLKEYAVPHEGEEHIMSSVVGRRSKAVLQQYCTPEAAKGVVHGLASWILAYSHDGEGYGFPFDMPYLDFYQRILKVHQLLSKTAKRCPSGKRGPLGPFVRLKDALDPVVTGEYAREFREIVSDTKRDRRIFERFRAALRICPKGGKNRRNDQGAPKTLSPRRHKNLLKKLRTSLARNTRRSGHPSGRASKIVVKHIDKYWKLLFGHVLGKSGRGIVVPRTNNVEEGLFRIVKRQCRRLHGRGHLSRDIDTMLPATPLILNLRNRDYCRAVYGGAEVKKIADVFSSVDSTAAADLLRSWREERLSSGLPEKLGGATDLPRRAERFVSMVVRALQG